MSSGFGFQGGQGRCYNLWKEVEECTRKSKIAGMCEKQVEDYLECLHHKKRIARESAIELVKERKLREASGGGHGH